MNNTQFWKNFELGTELDISGSFIYNGLHELHQIRDLNNVEQVFLFLYNVSVGIERLLKICTILLEHSDVIDQEKFEKDLRNHNHKLFIERISKKHNLNFETKHNDFIDLIYNFYKEDRYNRYVLKNAKEYDKEIKRFHDYIYKYLKIRIEKGFLGSINNSKEIKVFIGNIIGNITQKLFSVLQKKSADIGIYTDEIRYNSKASKIFISQKHTFFEDDLFIKELIVFLINNREKSGLINFIRNIKPLDFDISDIPEYINSLSINYERQNGIDAVECLYDDITDIEIRKEMLDIIGNSSISFPEDEEEY